MLKCLIRYAIQPDTMVQPDRVDSLADLPVSTHEHTVYIRVYGHLSYAMTANVRFHHLKH